MVAVGVNMDYIVHYLIILYPGQNASTRQSIYLGGVTKLYNSTSLQKMDFQKQRKREIR